MRKLFFVVCKQSCKVSCHTSAIDASLCFNNIIIQSLSPHNLGLSVESLKAWLMHKVYSGYHSSDFIHKLKIAARKQVVGVTGLTITDCTVSGG